MKIWYQQGSEHSANLVMIGRFESVAAATKTKEIIDALTDQVAADQANGTLIPGEPSERFGKAMLDLLVSFNVSIGPADVEQFGYDVTVKHLGNDLVVTTEENDISAFLKVMLLHGARIEIYSAHDHPDSAYGRGR